MTETKTLFALSELSLTLQREGGASETKSVRGGISRVPPVSWSAHALHSDMRRLTNMLEVQQAAGLRQRDEVLAMLQRVVAGIWDGACVEVFGSHAVGLATPSSNLDVLVLHVPAPAGVIAREHQACLATHANPQLLVGFIAAQRFATLVSSPNATLVSSPTLQATCAQRLAEKLKGGPGVGNLKLFDRSAIPLVSASIAPLSAAMAPSTPANAPAASTNSLGQQPHIVWTVDVSFEVTAKGRMRWGWNGGRNRGRDRGRTREWGRGRGGVGESGRERAGQGEAWRRVRRHVS